MIRRIKLVNFMSHTETVIEPADGLTILVGQNNCGKSAIVAALQILSGNANGDFMVRHGQRECSITVETDDGNVIEWRRKNGTVSYSINGRDVHRLQGGVPDDLPKLLRLQEVEAEGGTFDIHFAEQKNPIFLLNESASRRATFFASSSDAIKLLEMQKTHSRKSQDAKRQEIDLGKRDAHIGARLEALSSLDKIEEPLADVEALHVAVTHGARTIGDLQNVREEFARVLDAHKKWESQRTIFGPLESPPVVSDTAPLASDIGSIAEVANEIDFGLAASTALETLAPPPELAATAPLSYTIDDVSATESRVRLNAELRKACSPLNTPPELSNTAELSDTIRNLQLMAAATQSLAAEHAAMESLLEPPIAADTRPLSEAITTLKTARGLMAAQREIAATLVDIADPPVALNVGEGRRAVAQLIESEAIVRERAAHLQKLRHLLNNVDRELRLVAEEISTCPVCGQDLDLNKLFAVASMRVGEQP
jgi:exonuclease SbcC